MEVDGDATPCCSSLLLGNRSPLIDDTHVVSLPGIVEILYATLELPNLDLLKNDVEWKFPKNKPRGGYKVVSMRIGRALTRNVHQKEK